MSRPTVLVLAPMPPFPTSAGNRRRLLATCQSLQRGGFAVDLAYFAHEDQIYRRFGQHPPTDMAATTEAFQRSFLIEPRDTIRLKTRSHGFTIDEWCPDEVGDFVAWYVATYPETRAILVNYVFLSRVLTRVPPGILTLIDTHDRFADRQLQYRPFKAEPNFFYTDAASEAVGLDRAAIVLAIQSEEAAHFRRLTRSQVHLLPPRFLVEAPFRAPRRVARIGFIGHGNDPNLFSISRFAQEWSEGWSPQRPELVIAGEICASLSDLSSPGIRLAGYVPTIASFYESVDLVVAPMLMGSGLKMKVAEALAFGVPVVGTMIGFEGFDPVVTAHRATSAAEVKAEILALAEDPSALQALTLACSDLFARYNAGAETAEAELIALIQAHYPAPAPSLPSEQVEGVEAAPAVRHRVGSVILNCETSLRSADRRNPDLGDLVATERLPGDAAEPSRYAPLRRRWFVKAAADPSPRSAAQRLAAGLGGLQLAFSPEWVRDRALPQASREDLALLFAEVEPDWSAEGQLVGMGDHGLLVSTRLPSFLVSAPRPAAVFLIDREAASASERTGLEFREGTAGWGARFVAPRRGDLTPVPALLGLDHGSAQPQPRDRILFLTDDMIGVIDLAGQRGRRDMVEGGHIMMDPSDE